LWVNVCDTCDLVSRFFRPAFLKNPFRSSPNCLARILDDNLIGCSGLYRLEIEMKAKKSKNRRVKNFVLRLIQPTMTLAVASALLWLIASS
jgi:hypothetical protein